MKNYSRLYYRYLEKYKKSEQYLRELTLDCVSSVIPINKTSVYYKNGLKGIEQVYRDCVYHYNLYIDARYLFSKYYNYYKINDNIHFLIVSNEQNIEIDMNGFRETFDNV